MSAKRLVIEYPLVLSMMSPVPLYFDGTPLPPILIAPPALFTSPNTSIEQPGTFLGCLQEKPGVEKPSYKQLSFYHDSRNLIG